MDYGLKDKRVLVTGSTGGLGGAMIRAFAAAGAKVIVHGRKAGKAEEVCAELRASGAQAEIALGDLTKDGDAEQVARTALAAFGGIDVLVNNAGGDGPMTKAWFDVTPDEWLAQYSGDVVSAVRLIRLIAPGMSERKWGRIINISSGVAQKPFPVGPQYGAAKAAMNNFTLSLAAILGRDGVTVNVIQPGAIHTAGIEFYWRQMAPARGWGEQWADIEANAVREFTPNALARLGKPDEIAAAALFLASEGASYITGEILRVDASAIGTM